MASIVSPAVSTAGVFFFSYLSSMSEANKGKPAYSFQCNAHISEENLEKLRCFNAPPNRSLREIIDSLKSNKYSPPLDTIKVFFPEQGKEYTMAELDQMLNN
jgi:hypothetical protein